MEGERAKALPDELFSWHQVTSVKRIADLRASAMCRSRMTSSGFILDLRRLYDLVAEIPAQICCGSQVHFPPTQQRGSLVSILIIVKRPGLASGSNRISSAEPYNRYPARHADLIRDFYAQLSDEHSLDNSHVIAATGVAGSGRVRGRDEARMLCRGSGRYLHAAVEVQRPFQVPIRCRLIGSPRPCGPHSSR